MLDLISALLLLLVPAVMLIDDARLETEPTVHYRKCDSEVARRIKEILATKEEERIYETIRGMA